MLTVSDSCASGERDDRSGEVIVSWVTNSGFLIADRKIVPDDTIQICSHIIAWADGGLADVIITTGGTGFGPRDITPEATRTVLEREAPGIAEAIRAHGRGSVATAALGRGLAGSRAATLVVNLPGSPKAVADSLQVLDDLIPHTVELLAGRTEHTNVD